MAYFRSRSNSAVGPSIQNHHNDHPSPSTAEEMRGFTPERKSSKNSGGGGSFWSRKSLKRSNTTHSTSPVAQPPPPTLPSDAQYSLEFGVDEDGLQVPLGSISKLSHSRSLNPESIHGTPMANDPLADLPQPGFKVKYHLHNPLGPRWYKNHHLIPPAEKQPSARPPTFFSTSFPPISTSSTPDNIHETGGASKRASVSPQATPASSQTRIGDGIKPRSRKTSQTAPDNVDLMDVTDPWGSTWHHDSPYDILAPVSTKLELDVQGVRPRRASMTAAQNSFKAVAPSPLSQSTSAVHLHDLVPEKPPSTINSINIAGPRKLSKRRNPNNTDLTTLFKPPTKESDHRKTASAPPTPIDRIYLSDSVTPDTLPKRMSVAPPVVYPFPSQPQLTPKKEKRSSFVGRIAKKFSLFRRSEDFLANTSREYSWLHVNPEDHASMKRQSFDRASSHPASEKVGPPKRVAPPSMAQEPQLSHPLERDEPPTLPPPSPPFSYVSLEAPFSIGKLTVANPDFDPDTGSPIQKAPLLQRDFSVSNSLSPPPSMPREPSPPPGMLTVQNPTLERTSSHYDKPLPIPAPSTAGSTLGLSTPTAPTEKPLEQERADPASLSRRATVLSATSQTTATPAAPQIPRGTTASFADSISESDTDSSDSDSSSDSDEEKATSDVSNKPVPPDSTVDAGASTISAAPTLPAKDKPPAIPTPAPTPPPPTPALPTALLSPSRSKSPARAPETPPLFRVKSHAYAVNNRLSKAPPEAAALGLPVASVISGVTAGVFVPFSPEEMTSQDRINSYLSYTDSPCSATSVLANPPTPFHSALPIDMDPPAPPPLPAKGAREPSKEKESKRQLPSDTPAPLRTVSQTETFKQARNHSPENKEAIVSAGRQWGLVNGDAKAATKTRSSKDDDRQRRESSVRKDSSQPTISSSSSRQHMQDEQHQRGSARHSKVPQQASVSPVPVPKMPSTSNVRHSSVYNRYLDDSPPVRQYEESPPPPPPRDDSSSRRRSELRKEREREKEEEKARAEERRRREERRRHEEEKRYEEEQRERERQREKERARRRREREREEQREREKEREREARRQQRELERDRERERERLERERQEWERMERERERERQQRELELQLQIQRKLEMEERERERQRLKELEKERERERERIRELERDRERERERVRELEQEKEKLKQLEKEREKERQRLLELEREERLRELERERVRDLERERERLRQLELERERERLRQMELEKEKEREKERRRKEREERRKAEKSKRASQYHPDEQRSSDDSRSRRKRESRRSEDDRRDKSKSVYHTPDQSRTESYYANATQSIYLAADSEGRVERRPSTAATRPTSELPSAADLNALRAKDAWDMERMWKARSMYGAEMSGNAVQSIPTQSVLSFSDNLSSQGASYGSSYTAFSLQAPFQGHPGSSIYHSMPNKQPPIMYGSPASIPSLPDSTLYDPYDHNNIGNTALPLPRQHRSSHHGSSPPDNLPILARSPLTKNPLPEPPRESTYQPAPLPPLKPATATVRTSDYWAKYPGVTTNA